jgi:cobalt/nickel transport system permease protein
MPIFSSETALGEGLIGKREQHTQGTAKSLTIIERYQPGDSPIHRLDPRVKVGVALIGIVGITTTPTHAWPAYPALWALIGTLAVLAAIRVGRLVRLAGIALPFALAALPLVFTMPGEALTHVAGITISAPGVARFAAILIKSWLSVQVALLLAMTTPFADLLWALGSLRVPGALITIVSFMYRYLFTLRKEAERLIRARTARSAAQDGYRSGGGLMWRAQVAGGMVGSLFLHSYERSERVYAAMLARGYRGQMRIMAPAALARRDVMLGVIPVVFLLLIEIAAVAWWK